MGEPRTAIEWLEDFQACVEGDHGPEWRDWADEWIQVHADTPNGWKAWRELRRAVQPLTPESRNGGLGNG